MKLTMQRPESIWLSIDNLTSFQSITNSSGRDPATTQGATCSSYRKSTRLSARLCVTSPRRRSPRTSHSGTETTTSPSTSCTRWVHDVDGEVVVSVPLCDVRGDLLLGEVTHRRAESLVLFR